MTTVIAGLVSLLDAKARLTKSATSTPSRVRVYLTRLWIEHATREMQRKLDAEVIAAIENPDHWSVREPRWHLNRASTRTSETDPEVLRAIARCGGFR